MWEDIAKIFLFLKNTQLSFPHPLLFPSNKSQRNLKNKIYFQNKIFSLDHKRNSCLLRDPIYIHKNISVHIDLSDFERVEVIDVMYFQPGLCLFRD